MSKDCIFCQILAGKAPTAWVIDKGPVIAIMDAFPLRPGHVLVIPREHQPLVGQLQERTRGQLMDTANLIASAMRRIHPDGTDLNWLINDGKVAWQHVPHVHLHLIPRTRGDNLPFMGRIVTRFLQKPDMAKLEQDAARLRMALASD